MRTVSPFLLAAVALGAAVSLAGCGPRVMAPSLMPRAVEKTPIAMPIETSVEDAMPADPALAARIASVIAAAVAGDKVFDEQRARTQRAVARSAGAAQGSDSWVEAQQAVTALESARTAVRDAAAQIDALRHDPANAAPGDRGAIDVAATRLGAIETEEDEAVAALGAKLGPTS